MKTVESDIQDNSLVKLNKDVSYRLGEKTLSIEYIDDKGEKNIKLFTVKHKGFLWATTCIVPYKVDINKA